MVRTWPVKLADPHATLRVVNQRRLQPKPLDTWVLGTVHSLQLATSFDEQRGALREKDSGLSTMDFDEIVGGLMILVSA